LGFKLRFWKLRTRLTTLLLLLLLTWHSNLLLLLVLTLPVALHQHLKVLALGAVHCTSYCCCQLASRRPRGDTLHARRSLLLLLQQLLAHQRLMLLPQCRMVLRLLLLLLLRQRRLLLLLIVIQQAIHVSLIHEAYNIAVATAYQRRRPLCACSSRPHLNLCCQTLLLLLLLVLLLLQLCLQLLQPVALLHKRHLRMLTLQSCA
jgi:hypothetical protein